MLLNLIWLGFFVSAFAVALGRLAMGDMEVFSQLLAAMFDAARTGFDISIGLVGVMALWLGILRVGERAGLVQALARGAAPALRHLFPGVPAGHPAQGAMVMNVSANLLGLDNAATPLGLKAMQELQTLNPSPERATDAQILFIVLNTAGLTLIPTSVIAIRQAMAVRQGLAGFNAADIFLPTLMATAISLLAALLAVAVVQRRPIWRAQLLVPLAAFGAAIGAVLWGLGRLPPEVAARAVGLTGSLVIVTLLLVFLLAGAGVRGVRRGREGGFRGGGRHRSLPGGDAGGHRRVPRGRLHGRRDGRHRRGRDGAGLEHRLPAGDAGGADEDSLGLGRAR